MYQQHIILDLEMNPVARNNREASRRLGREIIEIGAVKLNERFEVVDRFQCYVRPQLNERITRTIRELTGIGYTQTHDAESFESAMELFTAWIGNEKIRIYSWSESDLIQLRKECEYKGVAFPREMLRWVDLQAIFPRMMKQKSYRRLSLQNAAAVCSVTVDKDKVHGALYDAEVTTKLLIPILDGSYRKQVAFQSRAICTEVSHSTYSLGQACGGVLQQLMARMLASEPQLVVG